MVIQQLIWDAENRAHIALHTVTPREVEEACHNQYGIVQSFRKRILVRGKTNAGRDLEIVLSPEDKNGQPYGNDTYYVITAYERGVRP